MYAKVSYCHQQNVHISTKILIRSITVRVTKYQMLTTTSFITLLSAVNEHIITSVRIYSTSRKMNKLYVCSFITLLLQQRQHKNYYTFHTLYVYNCGKCCEKHVFKS